MPWHERIAAEVAAQLPEEGPARASIGRHGGIIVAVSTDEAIDLANACASEHLVVESDAVAARIHNAGAVFVGPWTAQVAGDYAIGSNHVLPTAGAARYRGGLNAADFVKLVSVQRVSEAGPAPNRWHDHRPGPRRRVGGTRALDRETGAGSAREPQAPKTPDPQDPKTSGPRDPDPKEHTYMTIQGVPDLGPGLRLHLNENTGGCSPKVVEAVRAFTAERLALYPDFTGAVTDTAAFLGVDPEGLVLTNGLDEGILLASIAYLVPRAPRGLVELGALDVAPSGLPEIVVALPTFEPYLHAAKAMGARVVSVPAAPDYAFPLDALLRAVTPNTRIVYVNNPNNPDRPAGRAGRHPARRARGRTRHRVRRRGVSRLHAARTSWPRRRSIPTSSSGARSPRPSAWPACASACLIATPAMLEPIRQAMPLFNLNVVAVTACGPRLGPGVSRVVPRPDGPVQGTGLRRLPAAWPALLARARPTSC